MELKMDLSVDITQRMTVLRRVMRQGARMRDVRREKGPSAALVGSRRPPRDTYMYVSTSKLQ